LDVESALNAMRVPSRDQSGNPRTKQSCGLASFTPGALDVGKLGAYLWDKHRIIVTPIAHPEFNCIRVTPNVYTLVREVDYFADVVTDVMKNGIPV
jgi:selenocysteine lyase/cysteine desulfurase